MSETMMNLTEMMENNENLKPFSEMIDAVMEIPDEALTEQTIQGIGDMLKASFTDDTINDSVKEICDNFRNAGATRAAVRQQLTESKNGLAMLIDELKPSDGKRKLLQNVFEVFYTVFNKVIERYLAYDIELPIKLDNGAKMPAYAYDYDAAADLSSLNEVVVLPHTYGNMIHTGVYLGLPEGWAAFILPRSSIGAKTPLRLSNSQGVIDSGYRGELCVLFDNISDSPYTINAGDRIAQLLIRPSYRFIAHQVNTLDETDRGEGGFGSSGK